MDGYKGVETLDNFIKPDDTPTDSELVKAITSNWAFDHAADYEKHTKKVYKTADQTINDSDTMTNITELLFAVAASEVWLVNCYILTDADTTTPDIKFGFTGPSGAIMTWGADHLNAAAAHTQTITNLISSSLPVAIDTSIRIHHIFGILTVSTTAGNLQFQAAQNTKTAEDTKVLQNSCMVATRLV